MNLKFQTNEVYASIDYGALECQYHLYELTIGGTKKGYYALFSTLKENPQIIDECDAIYYSGSGRRCFAVTHKSIIQECQEHDILCIKRSFGDVDTDILLNLILILHRNDDVNQKHTLSNLDGKLFYFLNAEKDQIHALELNFANREGHIVFENNFVTFTKYSSFINKDKLSHRPKYELSEGRFLVRTQNPETGYIRKKIRNAPKNSILEFSFEPTKIQNTRIYATACVYKMLKESEYIVRFGFKEKDFFCLNRDYYDRQKENRLLSEISVVNKSDVPHLSDKIVKSLNQLGFAAKKTDNIADWSIIIINDAQKESDTYHHNPLYAKQCITKDVALNLTKNKDENKREEQDIPQTVLLNIVNQLQIKSDIQQKFITMFNFDFIKDAFEKIIFYSFDIAENENEDEIDSTSTKTIFCSSIEIDNKGNILQTVVNAPQTDWDLALFSKYIRFIGEGNTGHIVTIDNKSYAIKETGLHTMPNITKISKRIFKDKYDAVHSKKYFYDCLTECYDKKKKGKKTDGKKNKAFIDDYERMIADNVFENLTENICSSDMLLKLVEYKSCYDLIIDALYRSGDYYGVPFKRINETLDEFFACYTHSGYTVEDGKMFYFTLQLSPVLKPDRKVNNASLVRQVIPIDEAEINENAIKIICEMICVVFVRYGSYSTLPFLSKYIKELCRKENEKVQ